jgi:hypothetical protein
MGRRRAVAVACPDEPVNALKRRARQHVTQIHERRPVSALPD